VGIRIHRLDEFGDIIEPDEEEGPLFYIYEPNSETHVTAGEGYVNTPSIDGTTTLVKSKWLIPQTTTTWTESEPALRDSQIYEFGKFFRKIPLFEMAEGETVQI
jgi:hypothetical protein